jgi:hypothetical protein
MEAVRLKIETCRVQVVETMVQAQADKRLAGVAESLVDVSHALEKSAHRLFNAFVTAAEESRLKGKPK